jgi:hypothetical protein
VIIENFRLPASRALALAALLVASSPSGAQTLWGGTQVGMSVDQVKSVVKEAVVPQKPSNRFELLRVDNLELAGKQFEARFYFPEGQLRAVSLARSSPEEFHLLMVTFDNLSQSLTAKYGKEIDRRIERNEIFESAEATWLSGQTKIRMEAMTAGRRPGYLTITYEVVRDAAKL